MEVVECLLTGRAAVGAERERPVLTALLDGVSRALQAPETLADGMVKAFLGAAAAQIDVARAGQLFCAAWVQAPLPPCSDGRSITTCCSVGRYPRRRVPYDRRPQAPRAKRSP